MNEFEQNNYNSYYIKRQEQILLDQIKKGIDYEVRITMLFDALKESRAQSEEFKNSVDASNELFLQATRSIEDLTVKNQNFENTVKNLESQIQNLSKNKHDLESSKNEIQNQLNSQISRNDGLEREMKRLNEEMKMFFEENNQLKSLVEELKPKKPINKKSKPIENPIDVSSEENIF
jgi:DNA repair exonuclease SbcCD ATPase subunit